MESRQHGPRPVRPTSIPVNPFLGWSKWPQTKDDPAQGCVAPGGPGQMLLQEFLWQLEQRVLQVQEEEFQYCLSRGILGYRPVYPNSLALIPASEQRQLERLCGRIPPSHTAIVLSRLHNLLTHNDIPPWELVGVFKQVLKDFLRRQEDGMQRCPQASAPLAIISSSISPTESNNRNHMTNALHKSFSVESGRKREEIPTISSYVDKYLCATCPYSMHRDWSLPYFHPFSYEAYSTTL